NAANHRSRTDPAERTATGSAPSSQARRNVVPDRPALRRLSRSNSQGQWHGQKPSPPSRYNAVNSQTVAVPFFRARRHDDPRYLDTAICSPALIRVPLVTSSFAAPLENIFPACAVGLTSLW